MLYGCLGFKQYSLSIGLLSQLKFLPLINPSCLGWCSRDTTGALCHSAQAEHQLFLSTSLNSHPSEPSVCQQVSRAGYAVFICPCSRDSWFEFQSVPGVYVFSVLNMSSAYKPTLPNSKPVGKTSRSLWFLFLRMNLASTEHLLIFSSRPAFREGIQTDRKGISL